MAQRSTSNVTTVPTCSSRALHAPLLSATTTGTLAKKGQHQRIWRCSTDAVFPCALSTSCRIQIHGEFVFVICIPARRNTLNYFADLGMMSLVLRPSLGAGLNSSGTYRRHRPCGFYPCGPAHPLVCTPARVHIPLRMPGSCKGILILPLPPRSQCPSRPSSLPMMVVVPCTPSKPSSCDLAPRGISNNISYRYRIGASPLSFRPRWNSVKTSHK